MLKSALVILTSALLGVWAPSARASVPFWPIEPGWEWTYASDDGKTAVVSIVGQARVHDVDCAVLRMDLSSGYGIDYYVTEGPTGQLYEHGWLEHRSGGSHSYDPPRRLVPGELEQGMGWTDLVDDYGGLTDEFPLATLEIYAWVVAMETVETPVGSFDAYMVLSMDSSRLSGTPTTRRTDPPPVGPYWHARDFGIVRFARDDTYTLTGYHSPNKPAMVESWGEVKSRYRGATAP